MMNNDVCKDSQRMWLSITLQFRDQRWSPSESGVDAPGSKAAEGEVNQRLPGGNPKNWSISVAVASEPACRNRDTHVPPWLSSEQSWGFEKNYDVVLVIEMEYCLSDVQSKLWPANANPARSYWENSATGEQSQVTESHLQNGWPTRVNDQSWSRAEWMLPVKSSSNSFKARCCTIWGCLNLGIPHFAAMLAGKHYAKSRDYSSNNGDAIETEWNEHIYRGWPQEDIAGVGH